MREALRRGRNHVGCMNIVFDGFSSPEEQVRARRDLENGLERPEKSRFSAFSVRNRHADPEYAHQLYGLSSALVITRRAIYLIRFERSSKSPGSMMSFMDIPVAHRMADSS
jgi:hypothetical protein